MTEAEWLSATDPTPMLEFLRGKPSDRKVRLFAVACCRAVSDASWPRRSLSAITCAERYADGLIAEQELNNSRSLACQASQNVIESRAQQRVGPSDWILESRLTFAADTALPNHHITFRMTSGYLLRYFQDDRTFLGLIPDVLRDIFGSPFRAITFDPSWRTEAVVALARGMYESRDFGPMPVLADALDDAGCGDADVLAHCRGPGPHVRGCWVVDLVLGKN